MNKIRRLALAGILFAVACLLGVNGCKRREAGSETSTVVSAEKNSFKEVSAHLDAGGDFYLYLGTEQLLAGLSGKVSDWRKTFAAMPDLEEEQRQHINKAFDVGVSLIQQSGLEDVSGFGVSSIAIEPGLYRTRASLHHYPGKGAGFLWKIGGEKPHALTGLDLLPANTALATFSDLDVPLVWSVIQKHVSQSGFTEASQFLEKFPAELERTTGLKWDKVLDSLGGEFGLVITLDESKMISVPLPTSEPLQIPEPGIMIVAKVKDDLLFNRLDEALKQSGMGVVRVDQPDLKMRTVSVPLPLPIQLRPTVATSGGYLFIATTDALIQQALAVKSGKPGLKATDEFKRLSKDTFSQGNQFTFLSQRFGQTIQEVQKQAFQMTGRTQPARQQWLQSLLRPDHAAFAYTVSANSEEGWVTIGHGNQNPAKIFLVSTTIVPIGVLSAIAIPSFTKARQTSQRISCINNLRQIDGAKQQWALENNKKETDVPPEAGLTPFLVRGWPVCPQGGHYTINAVGTPPTCSIPAHVLP